MPPCCHAFDSADALRHAATLRPRLFADILRRYAALRVYAIRAFAVVCDAAIMPPIFCRCYALLC